MILEHDNKKAGHPKDGWPVLAKSSGEEGKVFKGSVAASACSPSGCLPGLQAAPGSYRQLCSS